MDVDSLIVGPPMHLGNMSAQLKLLIDRDVPVFDEWLGEGRVFNSSKKILKHLGLWEVRPRPPPKATGPPRAPEPACA